MKAKILVTLRVVISVGLVAVLLRSMRGHLPQIGDTLAKTNIFIFAFAAGLFIFNVIILSYRLKLLFAGEGLNIPQGKIIQLSFIGFFFNNFMPTAVGGDIVKAYYAHRETRETAKSFIAVFMDRFIGLFSFILIAALALLLSWKNIDLTLKKIILIFSLAGLAGFTVIMNDAVSKVLLGIFSRLKLWSVGEKLSKVYRAVHEYKNKKGLIAATVGVSIITQSAYFTVVYLLAEALGSGVSLKTVFLIMPIVSIVSMLPSLGGLGLREGAIVALFGPIIGNDKAFSVSVLLLATLLILSLIGGFIYVFASQFKIKKAEIEKLETYSV